MKSNINIHWSGFTKKIENTMGVWYTLLESTGNKEQTMKLKRILMSILGVCAGAVSVGFFKLAAFGVDPFQTTMAGIDQVFPLSFGTLYVIVNAIL